MFTLQVLAGLVTLCDAQVSRGVINRPPGEFQRPKPFSNNDFQKCEIDLICGSITFECF